jgi:hypothetical protein
MKKLSITVIAAILITSSFFAFKAPQSTGEESEMIIVKIIDSPPGALTSGAMLIYYGENKVEKFDLKKSNSENFGNNSKIIADNLSKIKKQGYKQKAFTGGDYITNFYFEKE